MPAGMGRGEGPEAESANLPPAKAAAFLSAHKKTALGPHSGALRPSGPSPLILSWLHREDAHVAYVFTQ